MATEMRGPERSAGSYETDYAMWVAEQVTALQLRAVEHLDILHIIEELEGLARKDRQQLENRLATMMEHLMKALIRPDDQSVRRWQVTINRSARKIAALLKVSPSLRTTLNEATYTRAFEAAKEDVETIFDEPFPHDLELPVIVAFVEKHVDKARRSVARFATAG